ncbi:helix-turn-helix domain-containing protein [Saccharopolyspora sp. CA-218241]|uniref:helix-turn-helix domain-containing protein n=1 Tax=Saccharopolyspora sp. CA-218241 TaxID=3240027 RepID=UPI003D973FC4
MAVDINGLTPRARALSAALRTAREASGFSGREVSRRLGVSHSMVSHWERGRRVPTPEEVASLMTAIGVIGAEKDRVVELARHASEPNWLTVGMPGIPQQLAGAVECERSASSIVEWAPSCIPGLLQTTEYARTIQEESGLSPHAVETRVMLRIARREVLTRKNPVHFAALIGENAVRDLVGTAEMMAEQLRYLVDLAGRPNLTVQVVPSRVGWHPGHAGPFVLYDFAIAPPVVHFEHHSSGAFVPDDDDVRAYKAAIDTIRAKALGPDATTNFLRELADEMERSR